MTTTQPTTPPASPPRRPDQHRHHGARHTPRAPAAGQAANTAGTTAAGTSPTGQVAAPAASGLLQRALITAIALGTGAIAGIGFAGSYTAVRQLALDKGFGTFSHLFPIGIDAGICVLLALDLLLTRLRIPYPLLRQTAWLLTAATLAFNAATAWPDPLGTAMHAVIPVLFVVAVEAARHAIGRIADITADKHMEGVRLIRWLLSPLPTFLLWRRMKLWEQRSYDQAIHLEQQRLTYQARLHTHYGRTWRRKAPAETLMPLRLARYGIPLAETAQAGLRAAGIDTAGTTPTPPPYTPGPVAAPDANDSTRSSSRRGPAGPAADSHHRCDDPDTDRRLAGDGTTHHAAAAFPEREQTPSNRPDPGDQPPPAPENTTPVPAPQPSLSPLAKQAIRGGEQQTTPAAEQRKAPAASAELTLPDRYYLAWTEYQHEHGTEPTAEQLSTYLAGKGLNGKGGKPISPSNLRRHYLRWRIYTIWAQHRTHAHHPNPQDIAHACTSQGITAQYNRPLTPDHITHATPDFQRRWQTLTHHHTQNQPP
jgi:hypothetical protein